MDFPGKSTGVGCHCLLWSDSLRPHESHAARQASLSITDSGSSPRLKSIESVMPSSHLILCRPLLLLPPIPPSIRVFSNESTLRMRWPNSWSFSFSIIPSKEGLVFFDCTYRGCWRRQWHLTPVLLPGKSHGQRSLVGYSPWGCKESNTTERLHFHFSL